MDMLQKFLEKLGIEELKPLQEAAIAADHSFDLVLLAPTGSGKTLAFLLPLIERIINGGKNKKTKKKSLTTNTNVETASSSAAEPESGTLPIEAVQGIIIVPSRELALQIEQVFKSLGTSLKVNSSYGGHAVKTEKNNFSHPPTVLIGTPGRLAWHIHNRSFDTSTVHTLILDEFDKSLEFGFQDDMSFIIDNLPQVRRKILTSATKLDQIPLFTEVRDPIILDYLENEEIKPDLTLRAVYSKPEDKLDVLFALICKIGQKSTLVFCNHREAVDRISDLLASKGVIHAIFHGGMEQDDREKALLKFRNGSTRILITTDLASRGLDIPEIECIIHYQLSSRDAFTHRNGRTARMHASGTAYLMLNEGEMPPFLDEGLIEEMIPEHLDLPTLTPWVTLFFKGGRKEKINKMDIAGLLMKKGNLLKEEVGRIEIQDHTSYAAIKRDKLVQTLYLIEREKLKNQKIKMGVSE